MEFTLFLVRHGETEHNRGCVIQGQLDVPLSEHGIRQAKLLAKFIHHIKWREIWTSDLKRSWQTANFLISTENNKEQSDNDTLLMQPLPPIQCDVRIRERHYGVAQGQSTANLKKLASQAGVSVSKYIPPEAESPTDVRNRATSFFMELCIRQLMWKNEKESKVLLVGHGGWLRELMSYLASNTGTSAFTSHEMDAVGKLTPNTAVSRFEIKLTNDGGISSIKCLGLHDKSHLITPFSCDELAL